MMRKIDGKNSHIRRSIVAMTRTLIDRWSIARATHGRLTRAICLESAHIRARLQPVFAGDRGAKTRWLESRWTTTTTTSRAGHNDPVRGLPGTRVYVEAVLFEASCAPPRAWQHPKLFDSFRPNERRRGLANKLWNIYWPRVSPYDRDRRSQATRRGTTGRDFRSSRISESDNSDKKFQSSLWKKNCENSTIKNSIIISRRDGLLQKFVLSLREKFRNNSIDFHFTKVSKQRFTFGFFAIIIIIDKMC